MKWLCEDCGAIHGRNDPPCVECGGTSFEKAVYRDESGGQQLDAFEWQCDECGRRQPGNRTPCTDCGSLSYEKVPLRTDLGPDASDGSLSRRELFGYGGGLAAVLGLGAYAYLRRSSRPSISNVPGEATSANGIRFADAEAVVRERLNEERDAPLAFDDTVEDAAEYYTRYAVKNGVRLGPSSSRIERFGLSDWYGDLVGFSYDSRPAIEGFESAADLGRSVAEYWLGSNHGRLLASEFTRTGIDVHVDEDGTVYVGIIVAA